MKRTPLLILGTLNQHLGSGKWYNTLLKKCETLIQPSSSGAWGEPGNTRGVSITVPLTSCLTGLD
jgi:hypothetical protein